MAINKEQLYDAIEQTKGYVDKHIEELLDAIYKKGGYVIVDSLPINGDPNKTYLVPKVDSNGYAVSGAYLEYIYAVKYTTGTTITDGLIDFIPDKFKNKISASGTYAFIFNGITWEYDNNIIVLTDYGINILDGVAVQNDTITVVVSNGAWEPLGDTSLDLSGFYNKTQIDNKETAINNTITTKETALNTAISGKEPIFRYATMPVPHSGIADKIIQYTGATGTFTQPNFSINVKTGYFYKAVLDPDNSIITIPNQVTYGQSNSYSFPQEMTITLNAKRGYAYIDEVAVITPRGDGNAEDRTFVLPANSILRFWSNVNGYAMTNIKATGTLYKWVQQDVQPQPQSISSIDDIEDVNITDPQNNQILVYDETSDEWQNRDLEIPSDDFDDLSNRPTNADLSDVFESGMPSGIDITLQIPNGFTPVGTIISVMGNTAPANYIVCNGSIFNITQYPDLANYFEAQFGTKNHFGGNGTTTFAVPDLRGEFLRGTGTNSHENQGSGANVGEHQDATFVPNIGYERNGSTIGVWGHGETDGPGGTGVINNDSQLAGSGTAVWTSATTYSEETPSRLSVRPTNTSVLYCIAYKNIYLADTDANYSLYDIGYFNTEDEKFYAEDTYDTEKVGNTRLLYISLDTNLLYRFNGEDYVPLTSEDNGPSLPNGGTTGQILAKHSNDDGDAEWIDPPETGGHSIKNNGTAVADESSLNFTDFDISDDATNEETDIKSHRLTSSEMAEIMSTLPGATTNYPKYSTTEQVVGEWIDGKPLYQKTFSKVEIIPSTDDRVWVNLVDLSALDMLGLVKQDYIIEIWDRTFTNFYLTINSANWQDSTVGSFLGCAFNSNMLKVLMYKQLSQGNAYKIRATLRYTKTTD